MNLALLDKAVHTQQQQALFVADTGLMPFGARSEGASRISPPSIHYIWVAEAAEPAWIFTMGLPKGLKIIYE